jgi:hypothetical protein
MAGRDSAAARRLEQENGCTLEELASDAQQWRAPTDRTR